MNWLNHELAAQWRQEGKRYAADVNEFVRIGMESQWQQEQPEPKQDERSKLAKDIFRMIQVANQAGETERLRREIPAASWPLTPAFEEALQAVRPMAFMNGTNEVILHAGNPRERGKIYLAGKDGIRQILGLHRVGCSPDGSYFALVDGNGIRIVRQPDRNLQGEETAFFQWKNIQARLKAAIPGLECLADEEHPEDILDEVIPFSDGQRLLLVCGYGVYLLAGDQVDLIHPMASERRELGLEDTIVDMAHGAVSKDGRWIAYGSQMSEHLLMDLTDKTVHTWEPSSSYPHYALFSKDDLDVWYNACHFYNGATIQVPIAEVEQGLALNTEEWPIINEEMRVYAAVALTQGAILGDAYGYLRLMDREGRELWRYFVGSTISGLAVTSDEGMLAVGTYGGMLHLIDLQHGTKDEYTIGTAPIHEIERWLLWRNYEPLRW
ncbi:PQQ-binding-like beta-propeller repeat protein [Paenibacillus polymyxa]|uniref:PQQ-binding-like beta-propeller repeat protein n=1 Tax=Paenibacillus polymyxa TaxID=1406 RepID=UPI003D27CF07